MRIILISVLLVSFGALAYADDTGNPRATSSSDRTEKDVVRAEFPATADPASPVQITPSLEPGLQQIEEQFRARMATFKSQMSVAADPSQLDALQLQAQQLKIEWTLALANRQLELARQRQDIRAETELLGAIDRILNPQTGRASAVPNEKADTQLDQGGAK